MPNCLRALAFKSHRLSNARGEEEPKVQLIKPEQNETSYSIKLCLKSKKNLDKIMSKNKTTELFIASQIPFSSFADFTVSLAGQMTDVDPRSNRSNI